MNQSKFLTTLSTRHVEFKIEYNEWLVIVHFKRLDKLSKEVVRAVDAHVEELIEFVKTMGYQHIYAAIKEDNKVINKLTSRYGLVFLREENGFNVYRREI